MSYTHILQKAQQEPDLQDVLEYLKKPLHLLQDLNHSYEKLDDQQQASMGNYNIKLKIDNIVDKYLPGLIDEYCKFSFSHRNTAVIKTIYGKTYTAKELLLKNIGKITEESILLHDEFYENNKFKFLVHDKIASDLGFAKFGKTQPAIALQNKFDYETYHQNNGEIFKKENVECVEGACSIDESVENDYAVNQTQVSGGGFFVELILAISITIILLISAMHMYAKQVEKQSLEHVQQQFKSIQGAVNLYIAQNDLTTPFDNQILAYRNYIPKKDLFYHAWGGGLSVRNIDEVHYAIDLHDIPKNACNTLSNPNFTFSNSVIVNHDGAQCGDKNHLQLIQSKKTVSDKEITNVLQQDMTVTYNNVPKKECELLQDSLSVKQNHCNEKNSIKISYALKD